ncbi:MAG TPA: GNAT family N-acetyltransferase [Candidatus Limnocylindria bacterium]|nr:GNAT family N-acetyltransferase [Candidatus Limnocylindria bacterium]
MRTITRGTWGTQCWDLFWRFTQEQRREMGIAGLSKDENDRRRREIVAKLARRRHAPVLVGYVAGEPAGFVSFGPRTDYADVERSRSMPRVDDVPVWIIPCMTVRKPYRGRGVALALLRASVDYARKKGAPAIEGYPRKDGRRMSDGAVFMGTESLFRRAGFRKIRDLLPKPPPGSAPRVTMRAVCAPSKRTSSRSRTRSRAGS